MRKISITLILLISAATIFAQDNFKFPTPSDYPEIVKNGKTTGSFVPTGWEIVGNVNGDLNGDKVADSVLVIKAKKPDFLNKNDGFGGDVYDTNPRVLIILFRNTSKNRFDLALQSDTFIPPPDSPVMIEPFDGIKIIRGVINFEFELWSSAGSYSAANFTYRFRYQGGNFVLIGADSLNYSRSGGDSEERSYNFLTRRIKITKGSMFEDGQKDVVTWRRYAKRELETFETFLRPFEWEIEKDQWL